MLNNRVFKNQFGKHYKITDGASSRHASNIFFTDASSARSFVQNLDVPVSFWNQISQSYSGEHKHSEELIDQVAHLFFRRKLLVREVRTLDVEKFPARNRRLQKGAQSFEFFPADCNVIYNEKACKRFNNKVDALAFINAFNPGTDQLASIVTSLELSNTVKDATLLSRGALEELIGDALLNGEITVVKEGKNASAPKSDSAPEESPSSAGNREAGLGPDQSYKQAPAVNFSEEQSAQQVDKPKCSFSMMEVTSSSGREAIINSKSKVIPQLAVLSTETEKKGMESISAVVTVADMCPDHEFSNFMISKEHKIKEKSESKISFDVSCDPWSMNNVFERVWLPSVKPKTYRVTKKSTCEAPDISVQSINVDVYPAMKWHWKTDINFGKLKFIPGKAKVSYSDLAIDGNVDVTYDGEKYDAKEKYKEYITDPLESFKKICDTISKVLEVINDPTTLMRIGTQAQEPAPEDGSDNEDGNDTKLEIQWPKLAIDYDSSLCEAKQVDLIDHEYSIKIAAKPLLDIDLKVDVLDTLMKVAPFGAGELIKYAKERIAKGFESENSKLSGEIDVIFSAQTTINVNEGELSGKHNILEHDQSGKPIKGDIDIPVKLQGVVKAEGKWFIISFAINYEIRGEAGWKGEFEIGKDEKGIYVCQFMEFTGIVVTLTRYEEVAEKVEVDTKESELIMDEFGFPLKVNAETDGAEASVKLEDDKIAAEAKLTNEDKHTWSWLEPDENAEKESPRKYYVINT